MGKRLGSNDSATSMNAINLLRRDAGGKVIIIANITMLILTIVSHKKYVKYAIYQLVIVLFSMLPAILITEHITNNKILCIVATGISIINLLISLLLCEKDLKEVIIRKFHM